MEFCQVLKLLIMNATSVAGEKVGNRLVRPSLRDQHCHGCHEYRDDQRHLAATDELRLRLSVCKHGTETLWVRCLGPYGHEQTENARAKEEGKKLEAGELHSRNEFGE
jgi:hypothetical protein